jgi:hypothetical protein
MTKAGVNPAFVIGGPRSAFLRAIRRWGQIPIARSCHSLTASGSSQSGSDPMSPVSGPGYTASSAIIPAAVFEIGM